MSLPTRPPVDQRLLEYHFPPVSRAVLPNGLTVMVIERPHLPRVTFRLGIPFGTKHDPRDHCGSVELLARLLKKGTRDRSYAEIAEAVDFVGGFLDAGASEDGFFFTGVFLSPHLDLGMRILSEMILHPALDGDEMGKEVARMRADLENERSVPGVIAHHRLERLLFSPHPYGNARTPASLGRITPELLRTLHGDGIAPDGAVLALCGDIDMERALALAGETLGGWAGSQAHGSAPAQRPRPRSRVCLIDRPGSEQVSILFGNPVFARNHPDYEAAMVANKILGGGASGRLFMNLREARGLTYGAYSALNLLQDGGAWITSAEVRSDAVAEAIEAIRAEYRALAETPPDAAELASAIRYLVGVFPLRNETASAVAGLALRQQLHGLPEDYWDNHLAAIGRVDAETVSAVARRYLSLEETVMVIVGEAERIRPQLPGGGALEVRTVEEVAGVCP